jgi:hypothetical protein
MKFNGDGTVTVDAGALIAMGSAVIHAEELASPQGHGFDKVAFDTAVQQARPLLDEMDQKALLPVRRDA